MPFEIQSISDSDFENPLSDFLNSKREMETIEEIKESQPVSTHQLLRRVYNE